MLETVKSLPGHGIRVAGPAGLCLAVLLFVTPATADVWVEKPTTKVLKDFTPEGKSGQVFVEAARNEYEGFQVVIKAGEGKIEKVTLELTELSGPSAKSIGPGHAAMYLEYFHSIEQVSPCDQFLSQDCGGWDVYKRVPGDYPDALIPLVDPYVEQGAGKVLVFDVAPNDLQVIWVDLYVPPGMPAGGYWGHLRVRAKGQVIADLPVTLTVWDYDIPVERSTATSFGFGGGSLPNYHGGPDGGNEEDRERIRRNYEWEVHRHRMDYTTHNPGLKFEFDAQGNLLPVDFESYDAYMQPRIDGSYYPDGAGINRYNLGMFRPGHGMMGMTEEQYAKAAQAVAEHLEEKGFLSHAYLYSLDEPWLLDHWRTGSYEKIKHDHLWLLKETDLWDGHVMITGPWQKQLDGIGDIWCPVTPMYGDLFWPPGSWPGPDKYKELMAKGDELWFYNCNANFPPQPGYDIDSRIGLEPRILSWGSWYEGATGFLHWRLNYWFTNDPWHDLANYEQFGELFSRNGDGLLLYPGDHNGTAGGAGSPEWVTFDGPIISYRIKQIRDGLEDWELFLLATKLGQEEYARQQVATAYTAFGAYFDENFDIDNPPWTLDQDVLLSARRNIAQKIQHVLHPDKYPDPEKDYVIEEATAQADLAPEPASDITALPDSTWEVLEVTTPDAPVIPDLTAPEQATEKKSSGCSASAGPDRSLILLLVLIGLVLSARLAARGNMLNWTSGKSRGSG